MADSIGIMEGAFFVGKNEILNWINYTYKLNLVKIEQACTGAVYCQIIDSLHPKKVKMHKVNWRAKLEHEFIANFKILQQAFTECKISKNIEVEKLVKGKYQDNLEFLQWMKRYYDNKQISVDYDPLERRNNSELEICNEGNGLKSRNNSKPHTYPQNTNPFLSNKNSKVGIKSVEKSINIVPVTNNINKESGTGSKSSTVMIGQNVSQLQEKQIIPHISTIEEEKKENIYEETENLADATESIRNHYQEKIDIAYDDLAKSKTEINTLKMSISEIGNQRDFYFSKLRDIEQLIIKGSSNLEKDIFKDLIKTILFSQRECELTFDEEGNVQVKNH